MRLKIAIPERHVTAPVLDAALEATTRLNQQMLLQGEIPSFERGLRYGVRWRPEPPGDEHFDSGEKVLQRRAGDCDDLAPWHAASLRASGEDPGARAVVKRSGPKRWHAVVQRSDGTIDDPSKRAGMAHGVEPMHPSQMHGVCGAWLPTLLPPAQSAVVGAYIVRPQIALREQHGQVQARADLPWHWREHMRGDKPTPHNFAMTALHTAPVAQTALAGAIDDVVKLAHANNAARPDHIDRLCAIADACEGVSHHELCRRYGDEHAEAAAQVVGSFFGKLGRGLGKLAKRAVSFVPGIGPIASTAMDMIPGGHKGGHPANDPAVINTMAAAYQQHPQEMQDLLVKAYAANPELANTMIQHAMASQPPQQQDPGLAAVGPQAADSGARNVHIHLH